MKSHVTRRPGFSLTELVIVMAAGSTLLATATGLVLTLAKLQVQETAFHDRLHQQYRFAEQFREDVYSCGSAILHEGARLLLHKNDQPPIVYEWDGEQLTRQSLGVGIGEAKSLEFLQKGRIVTVRLVFENNRTLEIAGRLEGAGP